jgi:tetratricopeptide (TPR) repeat protein
LSKAQNSSHILKKRVVNFHHLFFILFFGFFFPAVFSTSASYAKFTFTPAINNAYADFLKLKVASGEKLIEAALKEEPENGIAIYMANYGDVIRLLVSEDPSLYENLLDNEDTRIEKLSDLKEESPWYLFTQAEVRLQWAFVKLKFGDEGSAFLDIKEAYNLLEKNKILYPDFIPNKKSLGLLNILIGSVPEKYSWIVSLIGMNGTVPEGMKMLDEVIAGSSTYRLEAGILKTVAESYILSKDEKDLSMISSLNIENPDNLLIAFLSSSIYLKNADDEGALKILQNLTSSPDFIYIPFTEVMKGDIYLHKADYSTARSFFQKFLKNYKGSNFIKDSYYKIFLCYYLGGQTELAKPYIEKILENGEELSDADKNAEKFAKKKEFPNKILMKARLYSDGGYYKEALDLLKEFQTDKNPKPGELIEYNYRQARIYHNMKATEKAVPLYLRTIKLSNECKDEKFYFAPNSALNLGYIYRKSGNYDLARKYFTMALFYKNYEYKNSIDNKAKAALEDLNRK